MMGWLAVVILILGALSLLGPAALQQGWEVGVAGLLVGGLVGLLAGEALGYGLARREQARRPPSAERAEARDRAAASAAAVAGPAPDQEPPPGESAPPRS